jgi:hypothetical protein
VAPTIVTLVAIVGAHPFCNWMFHCGCGLVSLTAHCNVHRVAPPHCPWCTQPIWFVLSLSLALVAGLVGIALVRRRSPSLLAAIGTGLVGLIAGGYAAALLTVASQ